MNESCTPGLTYLFHCYEDSHTEVYNAIEDGAHKSSTQEGMVGELLPYQLRSDWMVTSLLFICFVLVCYVLMKSRKFLQDQFSFFFSNKDRNGLFGNHTSSDIRYRLILISQTCLLSGFCLYDYFSESNSYLFSLVPHACLLVLFIFQIALFIFLKYTVYFFVNWIFFSDIKKKIWLSSFACVIIWYGFLLFPIVLLIVYFDLNPKISAILLMIVMILGKILLFYKCFSNFFNKMYGIFHLILYFCALEVAPDLIMWKCILLANNSLVLNF